MDDNLDDKDFKAQKGGKVAAGREWVMIRNLGLKGHKGQYGDD